MIENYDNLETNNEDKKYFFYCLDKLGLNLNFKKIHVVGTNGKGSVSKHLSDNLLNERINVGLFTSPHIKSKTERIKINNKKISKGQLNSLLMKIQKMDHEKRLTFFHSYFLAALMYFEKNEIDVAILEAGIGANQDCTNYIISDILAITSISIDHTQILGNNIKNIAKDKVKAIKANNSVYYLSNQKCVVKRIIKERAIEMSNPNIFKISIANKKNFYQDNFDLAKTILRKEFNIDSFINERPFGRITIIEINKHPCILDVSHNYDGIKKTLKLIKKSNIPYDAIVVSVLKNKEWKKIFSLFPKNKELYYYQNSNINSLNQNLYPIKFKKIDNLKTFYKNIDKKILFIGSFYLISDLERETNIDIQKNL